MIAVRNEYEEAVRRQRDMLFDAVAGPIADGLALSTVTEVIVDPSGLVWYDYIRGGLVMQVATVEATRLESIITQIAGLLKKKVSDGMLEGEFPLDGSRVQAWLPPVSINGASIVIRKHRKQGVAGWPSLSVSDYELSPRLENAIDSIIYERSNVVIAGPTAAGKTTFAGAFLKRVSELCPQDRIVTIEDTAELFCTSKAYLPLHSSDTVTQKQLVKSAMRARPDRLIIGEVRGPEAVDMIQALGTGHAGFSTVHGGSFQQALTRVRQLCAGALSPDMISDAIQHVILMERKPSGNRTVAGIGKVLGWDGSRFMFESI